MNETYNLNNLNNPDNASDVPWATSEQPKVQAPDTSLPGSASAAPAAAGLLQNAARGAHDTIDRLADSAAPAMQKLSDSVAAAGETLHAKTNQLRETSDEWVEGVRGTVRSHPLATVAAALALGAVIARLTR